jgi:capsular exopolysaccharide synthesis family protein
MLLALPPHARHVVVMTGAERGAGTTFVAANLAVVLAQAGRRVLLVDGNLRKPSVHAAFDIPNTEGFTDLLRLARTTSSLASANGAGVISSGVTNLGVLPAGAAPADVGELLTSDYVSRTFEYLSANWDTVIVDSVDLEQVSDTLVLAHEASGCMLVARSSRTTRSGLLNAISALDSVSAHMLGVVLNDERRRPLGRFARSGPHRVGYALFPDDTAPVQLPRGATHLPSDTWRD